MSSRLKQDLTTIFQVFGSALQKQAKRLQDSIGGRQTEEVLKCFVYERSLSQCILQDLTVVDVPWNTKSYDMRLIVNTSVFLVHSSVMFQESQIFRTIISKTAVAHGNVATITIKNYDTVDFMEFLIFIYSSNESQINDNNVFKLLRIGSDLLVENLMHKCENYLIKNASWHSMERLFEISRKYKLNSLQNHVIRELHSNMENDKQLEFDTLSSYEQIRILRTLCKCRKATKQLDECNKVEFDCFSIDQENELDESSDCSRLSSLSDSVTSFSDEENELPDIKRAPSFSDCLNLFSRSDSV